jgi:hypothetical protein
MNAQCNQTVIVLIPFVIRKQTLVFGAWRGWREQLAKEQIAAPRAIELLLDLPNPEVSDCARMIDGWRGAPPSWTGAVGTHVSSSAQAATEVPAHATRLRQTTLGNNWTVTQECYNFVIVWAGVPWAA